MLTLRKPEIEHLDEVAIRPRATEKDVLRLYVPVHDPQAMGLGQRSTGLQHDVEAAGLVERPPFCHGRRQVLAQQQLHGIVPKSIIRTSVVVDAYGIGVGQIGKHLGLAGEPAHTSLGHSVGPQELDRDPAAHARVLRDPKVSHAAASEGSQQAVAPHIAIATQGPSQCPQRVAPVQGDHCHSEEQQTGGSKEC